jgi:cytochrome P450
LLPTVLLQRNPEYWGKTADDFDPVRFYTKETLTKKEIDPFVYFPFGSAQSPRNCPGRNLAYCMGKMAVIMMLQGYQFEMVEGYKIAADMSDGTLKPHELWTVIRSRLPDPDESLPNPNNLNYPLRGKDLQKKQEVYQYPL